MIIEIVTAISCATSCYTVVPRGSAWLHPQGENPICVENETFEPGYIKIDGFKFMVTPGLSISSKNSEECGSLWQKK